ncbi:hypothetical protein GQ43DRAFT_473865 [Delitschia confertaspora ATCC 74209]|uniref:Uncharacterized protein n=1 Tax=Delitschia confertaspora ATCC 74209 TaxID=1513339 RepID=A0A9P4MQA9_9PLEO|nr:hypothetical protein GQ43DRAFT_473865 [Delitschia confertaspora ATCC 74209]
MAKSPSPNPVQQQWPNHDGMLKLWNRQTHARPRWSEDSKGHAYGLPAIPTGPRKMSPLGARFRTPTTTSRPKLTSPPPIGFCMTQKVCYHFYHKKEREQEELERIEHRRRLMHAQMRHSADRQTVPGRNQFKRSSMGGGNSGMSMEVHPGRAGLREE